MKKAKAWSQEIKTIESETKEWETNQTSISRWETLHSIIDNQLYREYPDIDASKERIRELTVEYNLQTENNNKAQTHNESVAAHNAKVDALIEQKKDFTNIMFSFALSGKLKKLLYTPFKNIYKKSIIIILSKLVSLSEKIFPL